MIPFTIGLVQLQINPGSHFSQLQASAMEWSYCRCEKGGLAKKPGHLEKHKKSIYKGYCRLVSEGESGAFTVFHESKVTLKVINLFQ